MRVSDDVVWNESMKRAAGSLVLLLLLVLGWQVLHIGAGHGAISSPAQAGSRLGHLLVTGPFWHDIEATGSAFALAVIISVVGGAALGAILGTRRLLAAVTEPILLNLYALPKVTLYPVVLLIFGLGISAKIGFGVMHGLIPLTLFTMNAIAQLRPSFLRTARAMRLSRMQTIVWVIFPAILPDLVTGARLSVSLSLLGVLIGEMFASTRGLGHRVMTAMEAGDMATVLAVVLLLAAFAVAVNTALMAATRRGRG
jgi:NitT/TauT family transport system permease protein